MQKRKSLFLNTMAILSVTTDVKKKGQFPHTAAYIHIIAEGDLSIQMNFLRHAQEKAIASSITSKLPIN